MRPALTARAGAHGGVFTRAEALECGYAPDEIRRATRPSAAWHVLRRGAYVERVLWEAADDDAKYSLQVRAALLTGHRDAVASHQSGAVLLGMPMREAWRSRVHTTRTGVQGTRRETGVVVHPARVGSEDCTLVDGFAATGLARSAVDIGREHGYVDGLVACDAALRMGVGRAELHRVISQMRYWPGSAPSRAAVNDADGRAANEGETLSRELVAGLGIGPPEPQFELADGTRTAWVDLRVGPLLIEFDGKVKYLTRDEGGVSNRSPSQVVWLEKQREDWLRRFGYAVERLIWRDLFAPRRADTARRLQAAYHEAVRRVGPGSPLLLPRAG